VLSRTMAQGETITANTKPPVDKETSSPLAEIWTVEQLSNLQPPILDERLQRSVGQLVREWVHADELVAANVKVPRTTLLFGEPGTGKTRMALWAAHELRLPVVLARLDGLMSSLLGTTARNIRNLFDFANRYKCVLLLDEFDGIAKVRDDPQELGEIKRVVNAVLQAIDARASIGPTIAITNHEKLLDPAVWRRFDSRLQIGMPSALIRLAIIERYLSSFSLTPGAMRVLAWTTEGFSGSDIETMCDALKRYLTLEAESHPSLLDALETFMDLSASLNEAGPQQALSLGRQHWAQEALNNSELKITQADLAEAMGSNQSTVSRMLRSVERT
jgi:SpoVK/Ycf46/Vps4 family AAA+-type ATPase